MAPVPEPIDPAELIRKRRSYRNSALSFTGDDRLKAEDGREAVAVQTKLLEKSLYKEYSIRTGLQDDSNYVQAQMHQLIQAQAAAIAKVSYIYGQKPEELGPEAWREIEETMKPLIEKSQKDNDGFNQHRRLMRKHLDYFSSDIQMSAQAADKKKMDAYALEEWNLSGGRLGEFLKANPLPKDATQEQQEAFRIKLVTQPVKPGQEKEFEDYKKRKILELRNIPNTIYLDPLKSSRAAIGKEEEPPLPGTEPPAPPGEVLNAPLPPAPLRGGRII